MILASKSYDFFVSYAGPDIAYAQMLSETSPARRKNLSHTSVLLLGEDWPDPGGVGGSGREAGLTRSARTLIIGGDGDRGTTHRSILGGALRHVHRRATQPCRAPAARRARGAERVQRGSWRRVRAVWLGLKTYRKSSPTQDK
jgi:hypothetical protein